MLNHKNIPTTSAQEEYQFETIRVQGVGASPQIRLIQSYLSQAETAEHLNADDYEYLSVMGVFAKSNYKSELQNGDEFFFPVFSTAEDMGKYGESFSKVQRHFLEAVNLARNNKKKVTGIVINAFTEPFVMPMELLDIIAEMDSAIENPENE